jgi:hypothetical protein
VADSLLSGVAYTAEYWHQRAEEARAVAASFTDPDAKRSMLRVASGYEQIALSYESFERLRERSRELLSDKSAKDTSST